MGIFFIVFLKVKVCILFPFPSVKDDGLAGEKCVILVNYLIRDMREEHCI